MRNLIDDIWPKDDSLHTLLDIGCGDLWFTTGLPGIISHIGVDMFQPYLDKAVEKNIPGFKPYCMDLREYIRLQPESYYDAVVAIDVVEHFEEPEARSIIAQMERICKGLCIVWTTLGFIEQGEYDNNGVHNPLQKHLCAPQVDWFDVSNGWKVDTYPEWHGPRGGAIFAYNFMNKKPPIQIFPNI